MATRYSGYGTRITGPRSRWRRHLAAGSLLVSAAASLPSGTAAFGATAAPSRPGSPSAAAASVWPIQPDQEVTDVHARLQITRAARRAGGGEGTTVDFLSDGDLPGLDRKAVTRPKGGRAQAPERCRPGDTRPGFTCSPTDGWAAVEPMITNARKGDIILSPGCGPIGGMLREVSPPQYYSHSGIMVDDYRTIRHATAAQDYLTDVGLTDLSLGLPVDRLTFGWPGTVTQSVDGAFNGQWLTAPNGRSYEIDGFAEKAPCEGEPVRRPLVVSPPRRDETRLRPTLELAAEKAKHIDGYYSFYAYTDATIALSKEHDLTGSKVWSDPTTDRAPSKRIAVQCASFIWAALRQAGISLEGDVVEPDPRKGPNYPEVDSRTLDGLYHYRADERVQAANHEHDLVRKKVEERVGVPGRLGRWLSGGPGARIADQVTNCFANGNCSRVPLGARDKAWKQPGVGRTVSPDDILQWDGPAGGGVYGHVEEADYRPGGYVRIYRWSQR